MRNKQVVIEERKSGFAVLVPLKGGLPHVLRDEFRTEGLAVTWADTPEAIALTAEILGRHSRRAQEPT
jgi:hypothetical protein